MGGGIGVAHYFTKNSSLLTGPVWFNDAVVARPKPRRQVGLVDPARYQYLSFKEDSMTLLAALAAIFCFGYLFYAIVKPEKF
jgi:K+-transporting ATPase KdpF subunit